MKRVALFAGVFCLALVAVGQTSGGLSDSEVIRMVMNAQKQGMGQKETAVMLMQKGATREQLLRLKDSYTKGELDVKAEGEKTATGRIRQLPIRQDDKRMDKRYLKEDERTAKPVFEAAYGERLSYADSVANGMEFLFGEDGGILTEKMSAVFGRNIFNNDRLTFEPQLNIATPDNYRLGAGDEVIVDIWGNSEATIRQVIAPDGNIVVEGIGPVYLNGMTVKEANSRIRNEFGKIYAIGSGKVSIRLTLGQIRSIQVNVMGEAVVPGTYTLPSLASVFHALYNAGGVNSIGSLRSIKVYRGGNEVVDADIYDYLMTGKEDMNILLQDGDVVVVSPYAKLVELTGKVKRPMTYEMKGEETVAELMRYAGGFTGDAYTKAVRVIRQSGREHQVYNVDEGRFGSFALEDGDAVSVDSVLSRFENRVEVKGAVYREGLYAFGDEVKTLRQLLDKAEGVREDAFMNRAVLYREKADLTLEVLSVDLAGLVEGTAPDIELRKNDVLYVPSIFDMREDYTVTVSGAVRNPGTYAYAANMTVEDAIVQCGGLLEAAATVNVDVARRIKEPTSKQVSSTMARVYSLTLKDGIPVDGAKSLVLEPFDEVYIRRSPGYREQKDVTVTGEVLFEGDYVLAVKGERLSDLVAKAGGLTPEAYADGAQLRRRTTPEEKRLIQETLMRMAKQAGNDTVDLSLTALGDDYPIGINLKQALENPGSEYDVILKEGDRLVVPEYNGVVKITGAVMFPNTVVYRGGKKAKYYVKQAGGFAQRARKRRVYVVNMNGTVDVARACRLKVTPGAEVVVPQRLPRKGLGLAEILSLTSSTTSIAAMVTSIVNSSK